MDIAQQNSVDEYSECGCCEGCGTICFDRDRDMEDAPGIRRRQYPSGAYTEEVKCPICQGTGNKEKP